MCSHKHYYLIPNRLANRTREPFRSQQGLIHYQRTECDGSARISHLDDMIARRGVGRNRE